MRMGTVAIMLGMAVLTGARPATPLRGDSTYGVITDVKRSNQLLFDYERGQYDVRLLGVEPAKAAPVEAEAQRFVREMVLGHRVQFRFEYRDRSGVMVGRILTADSSAALVARERPVAPKDLGLELVAAGLAQRQPRVDYKYGELSAAEAAARRARRGLWNPQR